MEKMALLKLIREKMDDGRLSCENAHRISREHGVGLDEIGRACDAEKIKINLCQLGCFK